MSPTPMSPSSPAAAPRCASMCSGWGACCVRSLVKRCSTSSSRAAPPNATRPDDGARPAVRSDFPMLKLTDLRKTTRRSGKDGMRVIYPRFLRDASLAPRIEMALRYMERMLGQPRRALDDEVIVQLFGDHKVARCLVACLGAHYRHRPRALVEVLPPEDVARLAAQGIGSASELRLWLFRRVNSQLAGFAGRDERAVFMAE